MNFDYIIRSKYCPSLKRNVPIMEFLDGEHTKKCWNEGNCDFCCQIRGTWDKMRRTHAVFFSEK